jgi:uncharacterized protein YfeS
MLTFTSIWDVTKETAHPRARQLLSDSIVWDYGDSDSPLGTDTGADVFADYLDFHVANPRGDIMEFIREQLTGLQIPDTDWDLVDEKRLEKALGIDNGFAVLIRDDFIASLAFAQLLLEGKVDPMVRERAITALKRQATEAVLTFRVDGPTGGRRAQLHEFRRLLELV